MPPTVIPTEDEQALLLALRSVRAAEADAHGARQAFLRAKEALELAEQRREEGRAEVRRLYGL